MTKYVFKRYNTIAKYKGVIDYIDGTPSDYEREYGEAYRGTWMEQDQIVKVLDINHFLNTGEEKTISKTWRTTVAGDIIPSTTIIMSSYYHETAQGDYKQLVDTGRVRLNRVFDIYVKGSYIDEITGDEQDYPTDGEFRGYWYIKDRIANQAPTISGNSYDYGAIYKDFDIAFIVTDPDAGDEVTVKIYSNREMVKDYGKITLGVRHTYPVNLSGYTLGKHVIEVKATDKEGASKTNTYRFTKINTPPKFNIQSGDLGDKNTAFSFTYQVSDAEGDEINIVEYLDDEVIRVRKSVAKNTDLSITIDAEKLKTLDINKSHVLRVEAEDTSNGTATLTQTFRRANFAPIISGEDKNIGTVEDKVSYTFSVTDVEGDAIKAWVYLDSEQQKAYETVEDGKNYTFIIEGEEFLKTNPRQSCAKDCRRRCAGYALPTCHQLYSQGNTAFSGV